MSVVNRGIVFAGIAVRRLAPDAPEPSRTVFLDRGRILAMGPKADILRRLQSGEFGGANAAQGQDR